MAHKHTSDDELTWYQRGEQQLFLADAVDQSMGAAMSVGFARYAKGESNAWTVSYDEALIVTKGQFSVITGEGECVARAGEVIYLHADTELVYRAREDSELVYVSYPHWLSATENSPHADKLEEFHPVKQSIGRAWD